MPFIPMLMGWQHVSLGNVAAEVHRTPKKRTEPEKLPCVSFHIAAACRKKLQYNENLNFPPFHKKLTLREKGNIPISSPLAFYHDYPLPHFRSVVPLCLVHNWRSNRLWHKYSEPAGAGRERVILFLNFKGLCCSILLFQSGLLYRWKLNHSNMGMKYLMTPYLLKKIQHLE